MLDGNRSLVVPHELELPRRRGLDLSPKTGGVRGTLADRLGLLGLDNFLELLRVVRKALVGEVSLELSLGPLVDLRVVVRINKLSNRGRGLPLEVFEDDALSGDGDSGEVIALESGKLSQ